MGAWEKNYGTKVPFFGATCKKFLSPKRKLIKFFLVDYNFIYMKSFDSFHLDLLCES